MADDQHPTHPCWVAGRQWDSPSRVGAPQPGPARPPRSRAARGTRTTAPAYCNLKASERGAHAAAVQSRRAHSNLRWCLMPMPFAEPLAIIPLLELQERLAQFFDRVERPHPEQLFLERADEASNRETRHRDSSHAHL